MVADEAIQNLATMIEIASRRIADMVSLKLGKCGGFYKAVQMMRIAEAAGCRCASTGHRAARFSTPRPATCTPRCGLVGCDPGMDYQLRIKDRPVKEGGVTSNNKGKLVMPEDAGPGTHRRRERLVRLPAREARDEENASSSREILRARGACVGSRSGSPRPLLRAIPRSRCASSRRSRRAAAPISSPARSHKSSRWPGGSSWSSTTAPARAE